MQSLQKLCVPRQSVFDTQRRDTVLDIADLIANRIDPALFFEENYVTEGMKTLLEQGFRRLEGKSQPGCFSSHAGHGGRENPQPGHPGPAGQASRVSPKSDGKLYKRPDIGPVRLWLFPGANRMHPWDLGLDC